MKTVISIIAILLFGIFNVSAQTVEVNGKSLNDYQFIEVYSCVKVFSTKEACFIDTADNDFKLKNQDATKNQQVIWDGEKLAPGNQMKMRIFLKQNGWVEDGSRNTKIGNIDVTIKSYSKV
jgi:hypothetical protein